MPRPVHPQLQRTPRCSQTALRRWLVLKQSAVQLGSGATRRTNNCVHKLPTHCLPKLHTLPFYHTPTPLHQHRNTTTTQLPHPTRSHSNLPAPPPRTLHTRTVHTRTVHNRTVHRTLRSRRICQAWTCPRTLWWGTATTTQIAAAAAAARRWMPAIREQTMSRSPLLRLRHPQLLLHCCLQLRRCLLRSQCMLERCLRHP